MVQLPPTKHRILLLDTGPLGFVTHPRKFKDIQVRFGEMLLAGEDVRIPAIADYELRRELIQTNSMTSWNRLDER
jgi:hypothetical protein